MSLDGFGKRGGSGSRVYVTRERREIKGRRRLDRRKANEVRGINQRVSREDRRADDRRQSGSEDGAVSIDVTDLNAIAKKVPIYETKPNETADDASRLKKTKTQLHSIVLEALDLTALQGMEPNEVKREVINVIIEAMNASDVSLNVAERQQVVDLLVDDLIGFGPLETLLKDDSVSDIMVNGPTDVWVERFGKLARTDVRFDDADHVMSVVTRIVGRCNRRVDEASPYVDARLPDGSRINVIIPPLSVRGASISIRKFTQKGITLDDLATMGSITEEMARFLKIVSKTRLNVLISGGTGTGKTTLLNAMSHYIDPAERIVTIEDTAELQLHQPNLVSLECRPPNIHGAGEVNSSDLLKNCLRMRPDRIIVGEVRGEEAGDMLQAMNTGHDGSFGTIHANTARDALARFENMICMNPKFRPGISTRSQIVSALDVVIQQTRFHDGKRRVTSITEVVGMEEETVLTQDLFTYDAAAQAEGGKPLGKFERAEMRPHFYAKVAHFDLSPEERAVLYDFVAELEEAETHHETVDESHARQRMFGSSTN